MPDKLLDLKKVKLTEISGSDMIKVEHISGRDIAVIGMDGRFGAAGNLEEFWDALVSGRDCIRQLPENRRDRIVAFLKSQGMYNESMEFLENAYMDGIDRFDRVFFNISPREAGLMDPYQRVFLEVVWRAIEDSGYGGHSLRGSKTGVFLGDVGNSFPDYKTMIFLDDREKYGMSIPGNINSIIASRISYILDLKGPAVTVDTACSSSLMAVHMACQSLISGECDIAIAGGINIRMMPLKDETADIGIRSRDGRTRTFDDSSGGTGGGEGAAAVVLKLLGKALSDGDSIYAVIKGSASNQDGSSIGITAPSSSAQEDVIVTAWRNAGTDPESISYIEAHGTGTKLGDPVEIEGITRAFGNFTQKKQFCAISAVKTNIGHLDSAAGIAGFVKAVLALKNRKIPPLVHFERPNRRIPFEESPVFINDVLMDWNTGDTPRRCGVSSFGLSGTNCHIVLEEAPDDPASGETANTPQIFTLSAASMGSFTALANLYIDFLKSDAKAGLPDICYTANTGRSHHRFRAAILAEHKQELLHKLSRLAGPDPLSDAEQGIFFAKHLIVSGHKVDKEAFEISTEEKRKISEAANGLLKTSAGSGRHDFIQTLCRLAELYVRGADIDWNQLYRGRRHKRMHLPVYPFDGEPCWFTENSAVQDDEHMYHCVGWKASEPGPPTDLDKTGYILLLKDRNGLAEKLKAELLKETENIIEVSEGTEFAKQGENQFIVTGSEHDFIKLLEEAGAKKITMVLHMFSASTGFLAEGPEETEKRLKSGVYSIFHLIRAIAGNGMKNRMNIVAVTRNIACVTGAEKEIIPENAALTGLLKVISHEHPGLRCKCIDIGDEQEADCIIKEIKSSSNVVVSAFRQRKRYVEYFDKLDVVRLKRTEIPFRDTGAYIITGGTGGLGIETAGWLAKKNKVNLVLISRGKFPERDTWDEIISGGSGSALGRKIKKLKEIEASGSSIEFVSADVSDIATMSRELDRIRMRYGRINGVIHSAGVAGDGFLFRKDEETLRKVLNPKIHGLRVIERLTANDQLDFLILYSSVTSIGGAQGQGDYAAANSFLDSFSAYYSKLGRRALTINWPAWKETGMAVDYGVDMEHSIMKPISTDNALEAIDILLGSDCIRAVAGRINYPELNRSIAHAGIEFSERIMSEVTRYSVQQHERLRTRPDKNTTPVVKISGNQEGSYSDTQRKLAHIWAEILGLNEVSIYSSFSELGGDSIFAARLAREMQKEFSDLVDITDIFSYPTIYELSGYIDKKASENSRRTESNIDDVLERLEKGELTIEKAAALMEEAGEKEWRR